MAVEPGNITQHTLPESGIQESLVKDELKESEKEVNQSVLPAVNQSVPEVNQSLPEVNQSVLPVGIQLPTINEELAKIFPESAHKFLQKKSSGKRGRPRKYPIKPEQKISNRGRGRPKKVVDETTQMSAQPALFKKLGKRGRPRKHVESVANCQEKKMNVKESHTEGQQKDQTLESNMEREKLRKRPRLSYVDTYIEDYEDEESEDDDEEGDDKKHEECNEEKRGYIKHKGKNDEQGSEIKHEDCNDEKGGKIEHKESNDEQDEDKVEEESNDDVSEASCETSNSECDSSDESESGFESDNPACPQGNKQKRRKIMDCLDEELPTYRIMKESEGNQAGLSRYQILKVRLLKFHATKGRGRPRNKIKIAGSKRGRGRPRKNEMKTRTLKVSLDRLPELSIYSKPRSAKCPQDQGQSLSLSGSKDVKRKRGRPPKSRPEVETDVTSGHISSQEPSCSGYTSVKYEDNSSSQNESSCSQTCDESESKKERKKRKRKKDFISQMTSVSVSIQRLETVFNLKSLEDAQNIRVKQEENGLYEKNDNEEVCERQEAESIGIVQDINDTLAETADKKLNHLTDKPGCEADMLNAQNDENMAKTVKDRVKDTAHFADDKLPGTSQSVENTQTVNAHEAENKLMNKVNKHKDRLMDKVQKHEDRLMDKVQEHKDRLMDKVLEHEDNLMDNIHKHEDRLMDKVQEHEDSLMDKAQKQENRLMNEAQNHEDRLEDSELKTEDRMFDTAQNAEDRLTDTQNYYLNQELSLKRRGRPPKPDYLKTTKKLDRPLENHHIKKGRGRPRKEPTDPPYTCTQITMINEHPSGKARGRPKGRKNKQLEYEKLIEDIENKEEVNKGKLEESTKADFNSHYKAEISKSHNKMPKCTSSKWCPSANNMKKHTKNVSSEINNYFDDLDDESYTLSPRDIFEDNETDIDDEGKIIKQDQSVSQLVETGYKNFTSDPLPVVTDLKTKDCDQLLVGNGPKRQKLEKPSVNTTLKTLKSYKPPYVRVSELKPHKIASQHCSDDYISERHNERNQSNSVPELKQDYQTSPEKKPRNCNSLTQSTCNTKDFNADTINKSSAPGRSAKSEASIDTDQSMNIYQDKFGMSQQNFSGGMLDFQAPADPDFIDDDYLLAF
ncbi:uncharacterized protein DDB_G0283697-like isoform X2 [Ruditapes philippinarum]|uniref:uncharacterized protein DDB_G0283697-like isoform X2 n=1 Tax=Ruditapes philippinarum TaxID=129788 RepID=UPI00295AC216|nr:uncharacterized protein DDB_G0283697-like isoform X2 [Ruditapes philippinarum]